MNIPEGLPTLSKGAHKPGDGKACVMEYVALLAGESWTDSPACTHRTLALVAQGVNDRLPDSERWRLVPLIGRLFGTAIDDRAEFLRVTVGLADWSKEYAAESAKSAKSAAESAELARYAAEYAAESAESAAEYAAEFAEFAAESAESAAWNAAEYAAESAEFAEYAAWYAAEYAAESAESAAESAESAERSLQFLSDLLDEYDRLTGRTQHRIITGHELAELAALV